jgi:tetratricopeptide (TPR) repeat protein
MTSIERADDAWRQGRLLDARHDYEAVANADPNAWGALFQLAWLDGVFGKLTPARVQMLNRPNLSEPARNMLRALKGMAEYPVPLDGTPEDWDIENLRRHGSGETFSSWWESHGKAASRAGLYGVALACLEEAEAREPNGAYWDPPAWTHSLPAQLDEHLQIVAHPFAD